MRIKCGEERFGGLAAKMGAAPCARYSGVLSMAEPCSILPSAPRFDAESLRLVGDLRGVPEIGQLLWGVFESWRWTA